MQAFALKEALAQRGHEVILIRRERKKQGLKSIIRRIIKKYFFRKRNTVIFLERKLKRENPIATEHLQRFIEHHLAPFTPIYRSSADFAAIENLGFDAVVVGSDQVWRPGYVDCVEDFFLYGISDKIKKYAYAASFGIDSWIYTEKQTKHCCEAVKKFAGISVREKSGVGLCEKFLGVRPQLVLDPTLLFDGQYYMSLVDKRGPNKANKICAYILDYSESKLALLRQFSVGIGKEFFFASNKTEDLKACLEDRMAPSIASWIDSFNSADCVFTDSFHGCAFSIIFRKPFYVCVNKNRGADRFYSLLSLLGIEHCMITDWTDLSRIPEIDWIKVEERLFEMRKFSNDYLSQIN